MYLKDVLILGEEDQQLLLEVAIGHNSGTTVKLDESSLYSIVLRLLDFQCLEKENYRTEHGISQELADKVLETMMEFGTQLEDVGEIPPFLMLRLMHIFSKIKT